MAPIPRLGPAREFLYPAALCFLLGHLPQAAARAFAQTVPGFFPAHPRLEVFTIYAVHSIGFFSLIVTGFILFTAAYQQREIHRLRESQPT